LHRKEVSFTRQVYGGGFGAHKYLRPVGTDLSVRHSYTILNAQDTLFGVEEGLPTAAVGSIIADIRFDRRDNALYPRRGYKIFSTLEFASEYFGGDANFQPHEVGCS